MCDCILVQFAGIMGNGQSLGSDLSQEEKEAVLHGETTMQSIANILKSGRLSNVIVIAGAKLGMQCGGLVAKQLQEMSVICRRRAEC